MMLNGTGILGGNCMAENILVIILALLLVISIVIIAIQKLTILELRHEVHEIRRWNKKQEQKFWDAS
jgi:cell division protein FtsL